MGSLPASLAPGPLLASPSPKSQPYFCRYSCFARALTLACKLLLPVRQTGRATAPSSLPGMFRVQGRI